MPSTFEQRSKMQHNVYRKFNVTFHGRGSTPLLLLHGLGCDQSIWQQMLPAFENDYRVILMDLMGAGRSDVSGYSREKYAALDGHAEDLVAVCEALEAGPVRIVGHSVSGIIAMLAAIERPELFEQLFMVCASSCYLNDPPGYYGGFEAHEIDALIELLEKNHLDWAGAVSSIAIGDQNDSALQADLQQHFQTADHDKLRQFASAVFYSDTRRALGRLQRPAIVLQTRFDSIVPLAAARYLQQKLRDSRLAILECSGHYPQLTAPSTLAAAIKDDMCAPPACK